MPLPTIPNPNPTVTPAVEAVAYNELYIVKFVLGTADVAGRVQPIKVTFRPYNQSLERLYPDDSLDFTEPYPNMWELAYAHPLVAQVAGGLVLAFALELSLRHAIEAIDTSRAAIADAEIRAARLVSQIAELNPEVDSLKIADLQSSVDAITGTLPGLNDTLANAVIARDAALSQLGV